MKIVCTPRDAMCRARSIFAWGAIFVAGSATIFDAVGTAEEYGCLQVR
jgi:hypothetical protein